MKRKQTMKYILKEMVNLKIIKNVQIGSLVYNLDINYLSKTVNVPCCTKSLISIDSLVTYICQLSTASDQCLPFCLNNI